MDAAALALSPVGTDVPISGTDATSGQHYTAHAFLPSPLPATVDLKTATWAIVAAAEAALARLDQSAQLVPEPSLLRRPALRREAQSTSALEGTFAPFETVLASETDERAGLPQELREVLNYVVAAEEGFAWVRHRPITVTLLEALQGTLVARTPGAQFDAGRIRERQVLIGARGSRVQDARFVPPPPGDQLRAGLEQWVKWLRSPPAVLPPVVRAAMAHYQFETLHPFADGNGRIGRLLIAMQLMQDDVLREPILVVSPWFESRREQYQDGLFQLSVSGDWDAWVAFFAEGVRAAADTTRHRVEQLLAWREDTLQRVRSAGLSGTAERVAGDLIGAPILRAPAVAREHGITPQGAMAALRRLTELGVLTEQSIRGRVQFAAEPVIRLLST